MLKLFDAARHVSVPILVIRTADQSMTVEATAKRAEQNALFQWDAANGLTALSLATGVNKPAQNALKQLSINADNSTGFVEAMVQLGRLPQGSIVYALNAHRQLTSSEPIATAAAIQSVANLRDQFKRNFRMLVLLGPSMTVPPELEQDVVVLDHDLPGPDELKTIITEIEESAQKSTPSIKSMTSEALTKAVEAVGGLSGFAAEQVTAMSFTEKGLDLSALWERKRIAIEQTRGLSVYRGGDTFDDLRGLDNVKAKLRGRLKAKTPVGVVVWIDEGADVFANVEHDTSGVKTDQQRALLVEMENNGWKGVILTGIAGTGKSALARAFGNEAGVPTISLDFGDMEAPHVGESEAYLRQAIRTIKAVGRGNAFFILTCNSLQGIRPQFMRRFKKGVFFFDMLSTEERSLIWDLYMKKFALKKQPKPDDDGWTGAEIRECCEEAWDTGCTLLEASQYIIPVSQSRADVYKDMRRGAHGRFLDANKPGTYQYTEEPQQRQVRAISLPPMVAELLPPMKES